MDKEIVFGGQTTTPPDYASPDGDLHISLNVINEYGSVLPIDPPILSTQVDPGTTVFIHRSPDFTEPHFIIQSIGELKWRLGNSVEAQVLSSPVTTVESIISVGNFLIITSQGKTHYILFSGSNYKYLGTHLPTPVIDMDLGTTQRVQPELIFTSDPYDFTKADNVLKSIKIPGKIGITSSISDEKQIEMLTNTVMAGMNQVVSEVRQQGLFLFPRLLRVGLRLYDGSYANFSEPFLISNATQANNYRLETGLSNDTTLGNFKGYAYCTPFALDYHIKNLAELKQWSDVIKGLVIYSSSEFYDYDQNGLVNSIESFITPLNDTHQFVWALRIKLPANENNIAQQLRRNSTFYKLLDINLDGEGYTENYLRVVFKRTETSGNLNNIADNTVTIKLVEEDGTEHNTSFNIPENCDLRYIVDMIKQSVSSFGFTAYEISNTQRSWGKEASDHKVHPQDRYNKYAVIGITGKKLAPQRVDGSVSKITINQDASLIVTCETRQGQPLNTSQLPVSSLEVQESLTEEFHALQPFYAEKLLNYNLRTIYSNVHRYPYNPSPCINFRGMPVDGMWFYLDVNGKEVIVKINASYQCYIRPEYIYYPDTRCKKCVMKSSYLYYSFDMSSSDFSDGAVFACEPDAIDCVFTLSAGGEDVIIPIIKTAGYYKYLTRSTTDPVPTTDFVEHLPSTIITSNAMNPFTWQPINVRTVGSGSILGIATAAKPLSEGQSGQFPLYAFTDSEGVFSMSVSSTGALSPGQPILEDVVLGDGRSITSLNDSVMFVSSRGIVELQGGNSRVITDALRMDPVRLYNDLGDELLAGSQAMAGNSGLFLSFVNEVTQDLSYFLDNCHIIYEGIQNRIYVFPENSNGFALVYSRESGNFAVMLSDNLGKISTINSYPDSVFVSTDTKKKTSRLASLAPRYAKLPSYFSPSERPENIKFILLTRPLHLDARDIKKTVNSVLLRALVNPQNTYMALWGSNDLQRWAPIVGIKGNTIRNIHGSPYKYFRLMVCGRITKEEYLFSSQFTFIPRQLNKPR